MSAGVVAANVSEQVSMLDNASEVVVAISRLLRVSNLQDLLLVLPELLLQLEE